MSNCPYPRMVDKRSSTESLDQDGAVNYSSPVDTAIDGPISFFSRLPTELRYMIWEIASWNSRVVEVVSSIKRSPLPTRVFLARSTIIGTLYACRESRRTALKHYRLSIHPLFRHPFYVNPELDVLFLTKSYQYRRLYPKTSGESPWLTTSNLCLCLVYGSLENPTPFKFRTLFRMARKIYDQSQNEIKDILFLSGDGRLCGTNSLSHLSASGDMHRDKPLDPPLFDLIYRSSRKWGEDSPALMPIFMVFDRTQAGNLSPTVQELQRFISKKSLASPSSSSQDNIQRTA